MIAAVRVPPSAWSTSQSTWMRALAQRGEVDHRAQRAPDQALDLLGAARLLAARRLAVAARVGRARQHAVLGGDPAAPLSFRNGGTRSSTLAVHSTRVSPNSTSTEPSACLREAALDAHRAQLVRRGRGRFARRRS